MKKIYSMLLALAAISMATSCSTDNEPILTAGEDDFPRILNTDLPEPAQGAPYELPKISRNANFVYEAIVTPTQYTTVTWYIDGELVHEGTKIDMPLLAGEYPVKIVATTTRGLETYRNCNLKVLALEGDPTLSNKPKQRWSAAGAKTTITGENLAPVTKVLVGGIEVTNLEVTDGAITFNVPELAEGNYRIVMVDADGMQYGGGLYTISNEPFVGNEEAIWEGEFNVTWGTPFDALKSTLINYVKAGTVLRAYVSGNGQGTATTAWWNNILTGLGDPNRGDLAISGTMTLEYTLTDLSIQLLKEQDGFLMVGDGYTITKVTVE